MKQLHCNMTVLLLKDKKVLFLYVWTLLTSKLTPFHPNAEVMVKKLNHKLFSVQKFLPSVERDVHKKLPNSGSLKSWENFDIFLVPCIEPTDP